MPKNIEQEIDELERRLGAAKWLRDYMIDTDPSTVKRVGRENMDMTLQRALGTPGAAEVAQRQQEQQDMPTFSDLERLAQLESERIRDVPRAEYPEIPTLADLYRLGAFKKSNNKNNR